MFNLSFRSWLLIILVAGWVYLDFIRPPTNAKIATENGAYAITELEDYRETVRVLSTEKYHFGRESDLSPMDIAVGWGVMADPGIYSHFKISQNGRWYFWQAEEMPVPQRDVEIHSANVHLVPATPQVADQLKRIKRDDLIRLNGSLIEVTAADGWRWRSSLTRTDTGEGACELLLLKQVEWMTASASR